MAGILELMGHVQQQGEVGRQRGQQSRLASLMGQAFQAPREQRQPIFGQMAQVDPQSAFDAEKGFRDMDDNARAQLGQTLAAFDTLPDEQKAQAYPQIAQQARSMLGLPVPLEWNPAMAPNIQKLAQVLGGGQQGIPAGVQEFQYMTQGLSEADALSARRVHLGLDPRKSSAAIGYKVTTGPDGRPIIVAVDPREVGAQIVGSGQTFGSGVQSPQASPALDPTQQFPQLAQAFGAQITSTTRSTDRNEKVGGVPNSYHLSGQAGDFVVPPQNKPAFIAQARSMGWEAIDEGDHVHLEPPPGARANPFAGMTPGEMEAAKEAGKQRVQTDFLPIQEQIKTDAAIATERGKQQAQADVERNTNAPKVAAKAQFEVDRANRVISAVDKAIAAADWNSTGAVGGFLRNVYGTDAFNLDRVLDEVRSNIGFKEIQTMRDNSPTGGALGQVAVQELAMLQATLGSLDQAQDGAQLKDALEGVKASMQRWSDLQRQLAAQQGARRDAPPSNAVNGGVLRWNPATGDFE